MNKYILILLIGILTSCSKEDLDVDRCVYKDTIKLFNTGFRDFIPHQADRSLGDTIVRLNGDGNPQNWIVETLKGCYHE